MASPSPKLAESLELLHGLQASQAIRLKCLPEEQF